jgi:hypothetical protein
LPGRTDASVMERFLKLKAAFETIFWRDDQDAFLMLFVQAQPKHNIDWNSVSKSMSINNVRKNLTPLICKKRYQAIVVKNQQTGQVRSAF